MLIVYNKHLHRSWQSVHHLVNMASELLEADVMILNAAERPNWLAKLDAMLWRRRDEETCLVVCPAPGELDSIFLVPGWRKRFRHIAALVIDSFWVEHIPRKVCYSRPYDRIFITTPEDVDNWSRIMRTPTSCLPRGSDVLRYGSGDGDREWDLLRVGRQPSEWESDEESERACAGAGLRFHGRPGDTEDLERAQQELMQLHARCKFLLAFSNGAHATNYTHPTREYLTARWVDALASGMTVAGIAPKTRLVDELFWPGATLELGTTRRDEGLRVIAEAVRDWKPEQAIRNYRHALERLDWRWRLVQIAEDFGISPKPLQDELQLLKQAIEQAGGNPEGGGHPASRGERERGHPGMAGA